MKTAETRKEKEEHVIKGKLPEELRAFFSSIGEPAYRADQAFRRINKHFAADLIEFTEFPLSLRAGLQESASFPKLEIIDSQLSPDGTEKLVLARPQDPENPDKERVMFEAVWLVSGSRRTVCISSQSGCTLNCTFCATGTLPFKGNLSVWEILDQVYIFIKRKKELPTNIVFMGMGEPMYNYDNVMKAASILNHPDGLHLSARHITISTAGIIPGIERMIKEKRTFNLAVSLSHPDPAERGKLMDAESRFPLPALLKTLKKFSENASRSVTFEYVMIPGVNMSKKDAHALVRTARPLKAKINLIPYNPHSGKWRSPTDDEIVDFQEILLNAGLFVFNRGSAGKDISGACGMLACKVRTQVSET